MPKLRPREKVWWKVVGGVGDGSGLELCSGGIPVRAARPTTPPKSSKRWPRQAGSSLTIAGELISYKVLILSCVFINQTINVHSIRIRQRVWLLFFFCAHKIYFYININFCKLSFVMLAPLLLLAVVDSSAADASIWAKFAFKRLQPEFVWI